MQPKHRSARAAARGIRTARAVLAVLLGSVGCDGNPTSPTGDNSPLPSPAIVPTVSASFLAGAALANLGLDGKFARTAVPLPAVYPSLTSHQAESLAVAYWQKYGGVLAPFRADERGGAINSSVLSLCATAVLAESSYEAAPDSSSLSFRAHWGPRWIMVLCDGSTEVVVVSVAAFATALVGSASHPWLLDDGGLLTAMITTHGIPVGVRYPLSTEEAAYRVASATGHLVDSIPRLFVGRPPFSTWGTLWSVHLKDTVDVRGTSTGRLRARSWLWYGLLPARRWLMSVADDTSTSDVGPYAGFDAVLRPDGSSFEFPVVLARRAVPAFGVAEAVQVVQPSAP